MIDTQFFAPRTLPEALQLLAEYGPRVRVLAGGTDLMVELNLKRKRPEALMWIGSLGLEYIAEQDGWLQIGAATRMKTLARSAVLQERASALAHAAHILASPPVRSLATIGGNLCNASPGADTGCALVGLDAELTLASRDGQRVVPVDEFFLGPRQTVLQPGELLTEIRIRPTGVGEGCAFGKIGRRRAMTLAVVNTAARIRLDEGGCVQSATLAVGSAAPTILRIREAEALLTGRELTPQAVRAAAEIASQAIHPIDDVHGTAWYRRKAARVLVERTLREAGKMSPSAEEDPDE